MKERPFTALKTRIMHLDKITQAFRQRFPGEEHYDLRQRQTPDVLYALVKTETFPKAELLDFNQELARSIGLGTLENSRDRDFLNCNYIPDSIQTYATAYAGHQFGNWAGQLGDGRAIFAGEIQGKDANRTELQWKGVGATPYSRSADGRAVLRSTIREYLMGEAMHFLGVPTSRSLSLSKSGESVLRDKQYSGNVKPETGAFMMRTAKSFLRFGHLELLAAQGRDDLVKMVVDYSIELDFDLPSSSEKDRYLQWFTQVVHRTADLVVHWYRVGFTHGVLNTDNMSLLGLTLDYGPFSMLDEYDLSFTPNTTDLPGRRYAFGEQARIAQWNLWQLANSIAPLVEEHEKLQEVLDGFSTYFWQKHDQMLANKFGLDALREGDQALFEQWQDFMQDTKADYTLFFTCLEEYEGTMNSASHFQRALYQPLSQEQNSKLEAFLKVYEQRKASSTISPSDSLQLMQITNPKFIVRNYLLYECIEGLEKGDRSLYDQLKLALGTPYENTFGELNVRRPQGYEGTFGSSMLSCSS